MIGPQARLLADGKRLHLHHGPIDLVIGVKENINKAFAAAKARFQTVLGELVSELPVLRTEIPQQGLGLSGAVARRMEQAVQPFWQHRVTPMAAVAGSVAEEILLAMTEATDLASAYVNNGGDIALHLKDGERFRIASPGGPISISSTDNNVCGIATSGWNGRSFSLGIADSVTVLAPTAAMADVAATLIANAVDLPGSPKVKRKRACELAPDSDLGERLVTVDVEELSEVEKQSALLCGRSFAETLVQRNQIISASISLQSSITVLPGKHGARGVPWCNANGRDRSSRGKEGPDMRQYDFGGTDIHA